jgi:hypothetical protein
MRFTIETRKGMNEHETTRHIVKRDSIRPLEPQTRQLPLQERLVVQRDDGLWSIGWHDDAPGPFGSRRFAEAVSGVTHAPA